MACHAIEDGLFPPLLRLRHKALLYFVEDLCPELVERLDGRVSEQLRGEGLELLDDDGVEHLVNGFLLAHNGISGLLGFLREVVYSFGEIGDRFGQFVALPGESVVGELGLKGGDVCGVPDLARAADGAISSACFGPSALAEAPGRDGRRIGLPVAAHGVIDKTRFDVLLSERRSGQQ